MKRLGFVSVKLTKFLRWLIFLPLAAVLIALAQTATMLLAENLHWYFVASILIFFGWTAVLSSYVPSKIAPNYIVSSIIILTLFILFEAIAFLSLLPETSWTEMLARLYINVVIVFGAVAAYREGTERFNSDYKFVN